MKEISQSLIGVIVDKSKATRDYSIEYEEKTGKPYSLPFPQGSRLNEGAIKMAQRRHEEYLKNKNK
jgi:hypothetical protein